MPFTRGPAPRGQKFSYLHGQFDGHPHHGLIADHRFPAELAYRDLCSMLIESRWERVATTTSGWRTRGSAAETHSDHHHSDRLNKPTVEIFCISPLAAASGGQTRDMPQHQIAPCVAKIRKLFRREQRSAPTGAGHAAKTVAGNFSPNYRPGRCLCRAAAHVPSQRGGARAPQVRSLKLPPTGTTTFFPDRSGAASSGSAASGT